MGRHSFRLSLGAGIQPPSRKSSSASKMRPRELPGTWFHWGVDGLWGGGAGPHIGCRPASSCQVPWFPAARSSPAVFYEGGWAPGSSWLNGSAPSHRGRLVLPAKQRDVPPALLQWAG